MKNNPSHMAEFLKLFGKNENPKGNVKKEPAKVKKAKIKPTSRPLKRKKKV
jgi:hypothetical protein